MLRHTELRHTVGTAHLSIGCGEVENREVKKAAAADFVGFFVSRDI